MKKNWKIILIISCCLFYWFGKKTVYQFLWGEYTGQQIEIGEEKFERFPDNQPWDKAQIGGYDIKYVMRRKYSVRGRVVFVDWYDGAIKTWYHSAANEGVKLYNAVASVDLSLIHGATAKDGNWKKIKFDHEERGLTWSYKYADNPIVNNHEINNNHVIPANLAIKKAIAIFKVGDIVEIEGYLMDWKGTGKFSQFNIETAKEPGDIHEKQLYGGRPGAGYCRQFYVTKITFDGYTFE